MPPSEGESPIRLACVGASITFGRGLTNRREECYPAVLQQLLGPVWRVRNFGYSGATALRVSNEPYWKSPTFVAATRFAPQLTVLSLGVNDAQHANKHALERFESDLYDLAVHFGSQAQHAAVMLCDPTPVFDPLPEIDLDLLNKRVRPAIGQVATRLSAPLIDLYTPLAAHPERFPDNLHPDSFGARMIAEVVAETLRANQNLWSRFAPHRTP